ncbi:C2 domain-containing protein [Cokeromyces recurvatus]|uniref:C2 domain-containing protein n=1 Tax=Cokeromyces recurvatus TaxID=90255 RepID=UPI002220EA2E|nr:C2 domain-containing protein [Cokeromyces recurvatus]KAI7904507.1 C2 domain-containing protein [Cokeromyces recurvatus]
MQTQEEIEAIQAKQTNTDAPIHTRDAIANEVVNNNNNTNINLVSTKELIPDFRTLGRNQEGFATEIGSSDADKIKKAIEAAQQKKPIEKIKRTQSTKRRQPIVNTIAGYRVSKPLPDDSRIGWTAFSNRINPGGSLGIKATEKKNKHEEIWIPMSSFSDEWHNFGIIFIIGISFWLLARLGGSINLFIFGLCFIASYFKIYYKRFTARTTDDIKKGMAHIALESSENEKVEWLNNLVQKFWLIFEQILSTFVIENIDTYLVDYLPSFLDSVRLTTFTLGSKPFRIESVKSFTDTDPDTVCMDWTVSFVPNDTIGMTKEQLSQKINPKVVLNIRLGKGFVGTAFPVLVEDMSFKGRIRLKFQFTSKMPHIKIVEVCFMEKPIFDYVLKPIGGEAFGFDVNNIPGLQSFVRDQAHAILGPMLYYPNVFSYDIEKFFTGELDISQANGVLAVTVHSCSKIKSSDSHLNPFVRFFLNKAQELEKTSISEDTHTPHWNETKFLLLNNLNSILIMELRTTSNTKKAGKRLARAHFDLRDIKENEDMQLDNLELPMLRNGKFISNLKVDMRYFPVSKSIQNPDGSIIEAEPSNSGIVRIIIHECKNLGSNKVNPYALIKINGVDRFETPTFKRTSNPKFERPYEIMVLDQTEVFIRVSIIDRIDFAGDESLGSWNAYLTDIIAQQEEKDYWWTLKKKGQDTAARLRFSVQWKPVVMTGLASMGGTGIYSAPVGVLRFSIWSAENLNSGSHNAYVRIKSGRQVRARTEILDNTETPEWGEFHYIPVHSLHENLILELMDWTSGAKDKNLGTTEFPVKEIIKQCKDENENSWYEAAVPKLDRQSPLQANNVVRGFLVYSVEFYPALALPEAMDENEESETEQQDMDNKQSIASPTRITNHQKIVNRMQNLLPMIDLHGVPIRYTPDDIIDLSCYGSGILTVKIHEIKASEVYECYCQVMVDSLTSQHKTNTLKGRTIVFNETADAFIKDSGFSRVAIELKPAHKTEKDDDKLGYWYESSERIIRHIQRSIRQRLLTAEGNASDTSLVDLNQKMLMHIEEDDGEWYNLINPVGGPAQIKLSFGYVPLLNYKVNPDESLENQGILTVTLLKAKDLKAVDKSGTSDPYVVFTVNGDIVYKSQVIKKNCNPIWTNEKFEVPIMSRVTASFRIEVFDWNQLAGDVPLGSGGITIRGDMVESFSAKEIEIPLDGQAGDTGSVRVRFKWDPQLLLRRKTHTTFMGTTRRMTTKLGTTVFNWSQPPKNTTRENVSSLGLLPENQQEKENTTTQQITSSSRGRLTIQIIEARGLKGENTIVYVNLGKNQVMKSKKVKKTTTPKWNESFTQEIYNKEDITIEFKVKEVHTFYSIEIGLWSSSLWDLIRPPIVQTLDKWLPLGPEGNGEIHVKIDYQIAN